MTTVAERQCAAQVHGSWNAYKFHHCRCPEITARVRRSPSWQHRRSGVRAAVTAGRGAYKGRWEPDDVVVLRVVNGERLQLSVADRQAAIDLLDQQGLSAAEIARRLGCNQRTVTRRRTARSQQQAA